jgi:hypothetical protein
VLDDCSAVVFKSACANSRDVAFADDDFEKPDLLIDMYPFIGY